MTHPPLLPVINNRPKKITLWFLASLILLLSSIFISPKLHAVPLLGSSSPSTTTTTKEQFVDPLGRETPRGTVLGFIDAMSKEDIEKATRYFNLSFLSEKDRNKVGQELAVHLQTLLDKNGSLEPGALLSDKSTGNSSDNLEANIDKIGSFKYDNQDVPVLAERTQDQEGNPIWLISADTLQKVPEKLSEQAFSSTIEKILPASTKKHKWGGVSVGQWFSMILIIIASYIAARSFIWAISKSIRVIWRKKLSKRHVKLIKAFSVPLRLYLAVWILVVTAERLGISIIIRQYFSQAMIIVAWIAILLLLWRLIDAFAEISYSRAIKKRNIGAVAAILFFKRSAKFALVALGFIVILNTIGIDVTTGLAAFGIGGLALALGAQKTIENLVGSLNIIFDQPVRVGDFCQVGDVKGTIENIGMRSTRIRTLSRTVVTIPNGEFSGQQIENYTHRDNFLFAPTLGLRYETSPDQMRYVLVKIREILYAHPRIDPDPGRVRFVAFGASSLNIEILAYIKAVDYHESLEIQEDLNLRIADVVHASGTGFAFPSQTLYMARDDGLSEEKTKEAEDTVKQWREQGELSIPRFNAEKLAELKDTIEYPAKGSSTIDS